jgi:chloramphenicol 3-O phosphotransferase
VIRPGLVVVLDGASSVGKSVTLHELQRVWPRVRPGPLLDVGLDRTLAAFGPRALPRWWDLIQRYDPPPPAPPTRVAYGPLGRELVAGMHRAAAAWGHAGFDVAVDHVLLDRTTASDLEQSLTGLSVLRVGLECDDDVLEAREAERRERTLGQAVVAQRQTRSVMRRDLVLDTTMTTTEDLVAMILPAIDELVSRT